MDVKRPKLHRKTLGKPSEAEASAGKPTRSSHSPHALSPWHSPSSALFPLFPTLPTPPIYIYIYIRSHLPLLPMRSSHSYIYIYIYSYIYIYIYIYKTHSSRTSSSFPLFPLELPTRSTLPTIFPLFPLSHSSHALSPSPRIPMHSIFPLFPHALSHSPTLPLSH